MPMFSSLPAPENKWIKEMFLRLSMYFGSITITNNSEFLRGCAVLVCDVVEGDTGELSIIV